MKRRRENEKLERLVMMIKSDGSEEVEVRQL